MDLSKKKVKQFFIFIGKAGSSGPAFFNPPLAFHTQHAPFIEKFAFFNNYA
jgi:hypothetical protein